MTKEKKGAIFYYDYLDSEYEDLTYEQIGILHVAILQFENYGKPKEEIEKLLDNDFILKKIYKIMSGKSERATAKWNEINERYNKKKKENIATNINPEDPKIFGENEEKEYGDCIISSGKYYNDGYTISEIWEIDEIWLKDFIKQKHESVVEKTDCKNIKKFLEKMGEL